MLNLVTMKSDEGLYVAKKEVNYNGRGSICGERLILNGDITEFENTHHKSWVFFRGLKEITKVEQQPTGYNYSNPRWERDELDLPVTESFPSVISCEEACERYEDYDLYDYIFGEDSKFFSVRKFYKRVQDSEPKPKVELEFTVESLGEVSIESKSNFSDMMITRHQEGSFAKGDASPVDLSSIALYSELEEMLIPDLEIHNRPCSLSQDNTYKVIRSYVKNHIDNRYARVTSDYDFCFTVKKNISIKPYVQVSEQKKSNGRSYAKPRITKREVKQDSFTIFEMCPAKRYNKYTPIKAFEGENLRDLAENIKCYLDELMSVINQPLKECECCNGTGVWEITQFDSNKR